MTALSGLREQLFTVWSGLKWRVHGTGMLQAYLNESKDVRLHLWHRSFLREGMRDGGPMHNHRFGFRSHVLHGTLTHTRIEVDDNLSEYEEDPTHRVWDISPKASQGNDSDLVAGEPVTVEFFDKRMYRKGDTYIVSKWAYHWARQEGDDSDLTVTLVRMWDKEHDRTASIIAPIGVTPVHAFNDVDGGQAKQAAEVIRMAELELFR